MCTVNTLAAAYRPPFANGPTIGPGATVIDYGPGGRMGHDRMRFIDFARQMGVGIPRGVEETVQHFARSPITEAGPMAGFKPGSDDIAALGIYADDFPHRPNYRRRSQRRRTGFWGRPGYPAPPAQQAYTRAEKVIRAEDDPDNRRLHADDLDDMEEEERARHERALQSIRARYRESAVPVRESRGWTWCSEHQRWTRN